MRTLLKIIGGLLIGILIGLLLSTAGIVLFTDTSLEEFLSAFGKLEPGEGILSIITGIGALIVSLFLLVTIHEGGHLVCGLLSGYRFVSFRLFNLTVIRSDGRLRVKHFAVAGTGGQCLLSPPDLPLKDIPVVWYNFGGILANIVAGLIVLPLLWIHTLPPLLYESVLIFLLTDLFLILTNGIPMQTGGIGNDAYNIIMLRKNEKSKSALMLQLRSNALIHEGVRPKDMPAEWFVTEGEPDYRNPLEVSIPLMEASRLIDEMKWDEAHAAFGRIYSHKTELMPLYAMETACELVFTSLVTGDTGRARELYDTKLKRYIEAYRKVMSSKERILCAVALHLENDPGKARSIYDTLSKRRDSYLLQGEVKSDLAVMDAMLNNI